MLPRAPASTPYICVVPRRIAVVPHTHWDREWYEPFQTFRMRLVELIDGLLDLMESDASYERFLLDGQMAVIDDYLEIRPEHETRLRDLCAAGRLEVGPWYILMDEFLVSGETLVRDLQRGLRRGASFGGTTKVGYLPDMFGHVAQMPQLLRLAGLEHAVVWRGVGSEVTSSAFFWRAPDGSEVRTEYLLDGYGNGATLPDDAKALVTRADEHVSKFSTYLLGDVLLMNGSDHQAPQPFLGALLAEANGLQDDYRFELSSMAAYLDAAPSQGLAVWEGELRSGYRANMLMGVASNRVDVKRAAALTEHALERRAEPLSTLFVPPGDWPTSFLDAAWLEVVRNAAHDSICACSVDEVVDAVLHRFNEARAIADGLAERALGHLARSMRDGGYVVANGSARARGGVVEVMVVGDVQDESCIQVVGEHTALPSELVFDATTAATMLSLIQSPRLSDEAWIDDVVVTEEGEEVVLTVSVGPHERPSVRLDEVRADVTARLKVRPDARVRVRLDQPRIRRVVARQGHVTGFGWGAFDPAALASPATVADADEVTLSNGLVTVVVEAGSGTFSVDGHVGFGRLVDGGDLGDSYNYSAPSGDHLVDAPTAVHVVVTERGPVRASASITASYAWPDHVDGGTQQRVGTHDVDVTTELTLLADERFVRVRTSFVNPSRDHRLRVHLPTVSGADGSTAECAFGTVRRGLTAEGRPDEFGLPTFPSRRFVQAGRLTVVHQGLLEYEVTAIDDGLGHELAVSLLRSTGMLSRLGMALRPMPAGPLTPVDGLQMVGRRIDARYAVALDVEDPWSLCDDVLTPLEVVPASGGGWREPVGSGLTVRGAEVSSLQRVDGLVEVRVFNPLDRSVTVTIPGRRGHEVDLAGRVLHAFDTELELRARGIATLRLADERASTSPPG
jgi:mannosylglycerate hydrolase